MPWYIWAVILFAIGCVEHVLSEYENLVSVRLKVQQAVLFGEVNRILDGVVYFITFNLIWKGIEGGHFSIDAVLPYFFYVQGCVLGSALALIHYRRTKRKTDKERRLHLLEKANRVKKELRELKDDIMTEVETELAFEDISQEQEKNDAPIKEVQDKTNVHREAPKKEERLENPPPQAG